MRVGTQTHTVPTIPQKCQRKVGGLTRNRAPNSRSCLALVHPMWSTEHEDVPRYQSQCRAQDCPMSRAPAAEHSPKVPAQLPTHTGHQVTVLQEGGPQRSWQSEVLLFIIPEQRGNLSRHLGTLYTWFWDSEWRFKDVPRYARLKPKAGQICPDWNLYRPSFLAFLWKSRLKRVSTKRGHQEREDLSLKKQRVSLKKKN